MDPLFAAIKRTWSGALIAARPLLEAARDLTPIVAVILFFQLLVFHQPVEHLQDLLGGLFLVLAGLALFVRGLEIGLFPIGEIMAQAFVRKGSAFWLLLFAFLLGFSTTVAEPALIAIAGKAAAVAAEAGLIGADEPARNAYAMGLRMSVALSVGSAIVIGVLRIMFGWPLHWMILTGYTMVLAMTVVAPVEIIGIAYDAGGVTTSTITVPMVTALGVGLASSIRGRNPVIDGFGMIALASLLPMVFVMLFGLLVLG